MKRGSRADRHSRRHLEDEQQRLAAIGGVFALSRERVRQAESRALGKLGDSMANAA